MSYNSKNYSDCFISDEYSYDNYEGIENSRDEEEVIESRFAVWICRAAILQAVLDVKSNSKRKEIIESKNNIIKNLKDPKYERSFNSICLEAGFKPSVVKNRILNDF